MNNRDLIEKMRKLLDEAEREEKSTSTDGFTTPNRPDEDYGSPGGRKDPYEDYGTK